MSGAADELGAGRARRPWRKARRIVLGVVGAVLLVGAVGFGIGYWIWPTPDPRAIAAETNQSVAVLHSDRTEMTRIVPSSGDRTMVEDLRAEVSQPMRDATLAAEDISFYRNPGFDVAGILRAMWAQATGSAGGGSTITQQYIKLATGADEHSYSRKFKEVVLAFKVTNELSKDDILKAYLNTAYYGRGAYGIHAAAEAYFGKLPRDLDPSQSALLAGMVQRPTENDPAYDPEQGRARWEYVAGQMRRHGLVDATADMRLPETRGRTEWKQENTTGPAYHVRQLALAEAERAGFTEDLLQRNGAALVTTVDAAAQRAAEEAVADVGGPDLHAALVSVEPGTGAVRAYHSGSDTIGGYDWAAAPQQPGTAVDPVVRVAQVRGGPSAVWPCDGRDCAESAQVLPIDPDSVRDTAARLGLLDDETDRAEVAELLRGEHPLSATDFATAYATLVDGHRARPHFLAAIVDRDGREIFSTTPESRPAFDGDARRAAGDITRTIWPKSYPRAAALESGRYYSMTAWANGFTARHATSIVLSAADAENKPHPLVDADGRPLAGESTAEKIWEQFMIRVVE
ncbi:transglycosylase domain-containing protein [Saccharopolyspora sp. NFXS83]|uniref:transglycosylase domain-containing protein n=1 Tax=Saccharopolyspora sp. NFXS83 TaxID=2993560 RepID=UPI00224AAE95|nr:transglycosylase domain-containing protein [Saccharopolyspora sp. NFXS83]MCX2729106.1 transglycosylase domain-containing protein [Saccharopolyspora sp. NFXS83]